MRFEVRFVWILFMNFFRKCVFLEGVRGGFGERFWLYGKWVFFLELGFFWGSRSSIFCLVGFVGMFGFLSR